MRQTLWIAVAVAAGLPVQFLSAQVTTATIYGTVLDPAGAPIPNAVVKVLNPNTGQERSTVTTVEGQFTLTSLPIGTYGLTIEAAGFKTEHRSDVTVAAGQKIDIAFSLQVGSFTERIDVKAEAPLINTVTAEQRSVVAGKQQVDELPVLRRDWTNLLRLGNGLTAGGRSGVGLSMNGLPPSGFRLTVDGTDSEGDAENPSLAMFGNFNYIKGVSLEAIAEVGVARGIASAEIANTMAGNVNVITRSGTNQFHGSLFLNNQTEDVAARNQFLSSKAPLVFNQFGGSVGGPAVKNRLFFFGVYEGYREVAFRALSGNVPTAGFRQLATAAEPAFQPFFDLFPLPTSPAAPGAVTGFYQGAGSNLGTDNHATARVDFYLTQSNQLTARYTRGRPFREVPRVQFNPQTFHGVSEVGNLSWLHSRTAWTSEFRVGYNRNEVDRVDLMYTLAVPGISCCLGFSAGGEWLFKNGSTKSFEEIASLRKGPHSIKFGGIVFRRLAGRANIETPAIQFATTADFLANAPSVAQVTYGVNPFLVRNWQFGFFIQDDFKVRSNLTLNLGIRYDYVAVPDERDGRLFNRDAPYGYGPLRDPDSIWDADPVNFSPRVGFAWTPGRSGSTVLRGGAGYFHSARPLFDTAVELIRNAIDEPRRYVFNRQEIVRYGLKYPITNAGTLPLVKNPNAPWSGDTVSTDMPTPYSVQWSLALERQLLPSLALETGYTGNRGMRINYLRYQNQVDRLTGANPIAGFGEFRYTDPSDSSHYHAWQTAMRKRFSKGLVWNAYYTWSSTISYSTNDFQFGQTPQDVNNIRAEKGPAPTDIRHVFASDFLYELPLSRFGSGGRGWRLLLANWQIGGLLSARSGDPITVTQGSAARDSRPDAVGGAPYRDDYQASLQYLNPAAFARIPLVPASGATARFGNLGRNVFWAPGAWTLDLALSKTLAFTERLRLQIRADAFNAFNHTNLAGVSTDINSGNFGRLTRADARVVQFNARMTF